MKRGWGVKLEEDWVALLSNYKDLMAQRGSYLVKRKAFPLINKDLISLSAADA